MRDTRISIDIFFIFANIYGQKAPPKTNIIQVKSEVLRISIIQHLTKFYDLLKFVVPVRGEPFSFLYNETVLLCTVYELSWSTVSINSF